MLLRGRGEGAGVGKATRRGRKARKEREDRILGPFVRTLGSCEK